MFAMIGGGFGLTFAIIRDGLLPAELPWWAWLILVPVNLVLAVLAGWLLDLLLQTIEWLLFARRRCPRCGGRRWSWGFTEGFWIVMR
jgi:hypothetical protein